MSRAVATRFLNDFGDKYTFTLQEQDGTASDLTGMTVRVHIRREATPDVVTNKSVTILSPATNGIVEYEVATGDFPSVGKYYLQFQGTFGATKVITWDVAEIFVQAEIA